MMDYVTYVLPIAVFCGAVVGIIYWRLDTTRIKLMPSLIVSAVGSAVGSIISYLSNDSGVVLLVSALIVPVLLLLVLRPILLRPHVGAPPSAHAKQVAVEHDASESPPPGPKPASSRSAAAPGVFISYRRQDAPDLAGRLFDRLEERFGADRVFMDVDSIEPGLDFRAVISRAVSSCAVLLAVIGDKWLTVTDARGRRRLDNPDDYVRLEVEAGLTRDVRVIPVLVEGVAMPDSRELPDALSQLAGRNALEISHARFRRDAESLIAVVERIFAEASHQDP
jgi:TIR domain